MKVTYLPEDGTNFITYGISGNIIDFNNGDMMFNVSKKERDYNIEIDVCMDHTGALVNSVDEGLRYVAQLLIPARAYTEIDTPNPNYVEGGTEPETIVTMTPVPFNIDNCELRLWELEV